MNKTDEYGCAMCINCHEWDFQYYCKFDKEDRNLTGGGPGCNYIPSRFEKIPTEDTPFKNKKR